ncbi:MAG TPA: RidA family protein [Phenylobacterium sp.]|jgi:enamine deaminase RidA (YjgF/YER057c/UK114 family)|uniref:RidA family protein n=1 Tax=Phenylobacterium sp. TaxID=1871053 RepID=UPI002BA0418E|nr:RidA family protein [Phenylobacterium sp.]HXA37485.1 RidA family protein [Phenylobacterium sp.]
MTETRTIKRVPHPWKHVKGRSAGSIHGDLVWLAGVADTDAPDIDVQTTDLFAKLDRLLADAGADRTRILSASIHLADLKDKPVFDRAWDRWVGDDPAHWPQRTCVGGELIGRYLVEIKLVATRR